MNSSKAETKELLDDVTNMLIDKGCTVNKPAMLNLALYIAEREKNLIERLIPPGVDLDE